LKNTDLWGNKLRSSFMFLRRKTCCQTFSVTVDYISILHPTFLVLFLVCSFTWHTLINNAVLLCLSLRPDRIMCNSSAKYYSLPDGLLNKSSVCVCYQTLELIYQIPPLVHMSKLCIRTLKHWIHKKSWYISVCEHREQVLIVKSNRTA